MFVYSCCKQQRLNPCFVPLPSQDSKPLGRRSLWRLWPCFVSADLAQLRCVLQSLPCENDKLKWYMCGLTCAAQESLGWQTIVCVCVCVCVCVFGTYLLSWGEFGVLHGLGRASGKTLLPTHLSPWVVAAYISARGAWMSFVTPSILLHFLLQVWFFLHRAHFLFKCGELLNIKSLVFHSLFPDILQYTFPKKCYIYQLWQMN